MKSNITKPQLAKYLKQCRETAGYNQQQMAAHLGVNYVSYNKYERGDAMPRYRTLAQIMDQARDICELPPFEADSEGAVVQESHDPALARKPGDALLKRPDPLDEERSFEQQMNDLGVQVVRPEKPQEAPQEERPQIVWRGGSMYGKGSGGIGNMISITKTNISIGKPLMDAIGPDGRLEFGVMEKNGRKMVAMKKVKHGLKPYRTRDTSGARVGSKSLLGWLAEAGIVRGLYRVSEVKGGWVAVLEAARE